MALIVIAGVIVLMVVSSVLNGWALSILWGWFFVPTLGMPQISVVQAIGIAMVVSYLTYQYIDDESNNLIRPFILAFARPFIAVIIGAIVHAFM